MGPAATQPETGRLVVIFDMGMIIQHGKLWKIMENYGNISSKYGNILGISLEYPL